jgi:hypothetical protein
MEFTIPKSAEAPLAEFIKLSGEQVKRFADAIHQSKPALLVEDFANEVASKCGEDPGKVEEIVSMFAGMYLARISVGKSVDDFVADFTSALQKRGKKQLAPQDWPGFEQGLKSILSAEDSLGITAKALDLLTDQEHGCHSVRILSDIRHIFSSDASQRPKAALVLHTLNLVYHEIGGLKEIYVALDSSDLKRLKSAIERAEIKERNLKALLKESGFDFLEGR